MKFELEVWRQEDASREGRFEVYEVDGITADMSFLEMLDVANLQLAEAGIAPIEFDYDCREGICGSCSLVINGRPHGPRQASTTCQTYMRHFEECLLEDKRPRVDEIEGAKCIAVCAAAWESVETGQPAKVFNDF